MEFKYVKRSKDKRTKIRSKSSKNQLILLGKTKRENGRRSSKRCIVGF